MSTLGSIFRVTTFGESHGIAVGCVVDGVPAGFSLDESDIQPLLDRRRPGQNSITTSRTEVDKVEILSGTERGMTLGSPIAMLVKNKDMRKVDYETVSNVPRPGHADYTYQAKYGIRACSGGGRSSARETVGRVCAGALAAKYLRESLGIEIVAFVDSVMEISIPDEIRNSFLNNPPSCAEVDRLSAVIRTTDGSQYIDCNNAVFDCIDKEMNIIESGKIVDSVPTGEAICTRCPDGKTSAAMAARIALVKSQKDSCGGVITGIISNVPAGLGEPVFDKFQAELGKAMLSIPAVKGFEIGCGFNGSRSMTGSVHNDCFVNGDISGLSKLSTKTNNCGGLLGGITNGNTIHFRVAFKPVSSIWVAQATCDFDGESVTLELEGRHDPCVVPRAVPIVESMAAIVVMDLLLRHRAVNNL